MPKAQICKALLPLSVPRSMLSSPHPSTHTATNGALGVRGIWCLVINISAPRSTPTPSSAPRHLAVAAGPAPLPLTHKETDKILLVSTFTGTKQASYRSGMVEGVEMVPLERALNDQWWIFV